MATSFEVVFVRDLGARFTQRKNFIAELEQAIPEFYERVGQHLKAWQPQAPKVKPDRNEPENVSTEALREDAEAAAADRNIPAE
ncbi:hypothetical protein [Chelativorans sp. Marseille-P2723]|uniref:hypothetical protein n=1 Tax=Chelativorans sp. Marseille-P2723 TaxID=2709133 RepID=UPI001AEE7998|nr:hypothetical protein [Chelativorans sp. Marseille-P2723]